jgi:hypothetical protein
VRLVPLALLAQLDHLDLLARLAQRVLQAQQAPLALKAQPDLRVLLEPLAQVVQLVRQAPQGLLAHLARLALLERALPILAQCQLQLTFPVIQALTQAMSVMLTSPSTRQICGSGMALIGWIMGQLYLLLDQLVQRGPLGQRERPGQPD